MRLVLGMFPSNFFMVVLCYSKPEPHPVDDFSKYFVLEVKNFCGAVITFSEINLTIRLGVFICDAPVKGFLKQVVRHTAKHPCECCEIVGEFVAHRAVFKAQTSYLLTFYESFIQLLY